MGSASTLDLFFLLQLIMLISFASAQTDDEECPLVQYLPVHQSGIVNCSFPESTYGVKWEDGSPEPIAVLMGGTKSGDGITSGEYDIVDSSGSLRIKSVGIYEKHFVVTKIPSADDTVPEVRYAVTVTPTVTPEEPYPRILECEDESGSSCIIEVNGPSLFSCEVRGAAPVIDLGWIERTPVMDNNIEQDTSHTFVGFPASTLTTYKTYPDVNSTELLSELVCKAVDDPAGLLNRAEAFVFVENKDSPAFDVEPIKRYFVKSAKEIVLPCDGAFDAYLVVWKELGPRAKDLHGESINLIYKTDDQQKYFLPMNNYRTLGYNSRLKIRGDEIENSGVYYCIAKTQEKEILTAYDVTIYVNPVPPHLVVGGCSPNEPCVQEVYARGELNCSVYGIHPAVILSWRPFYENDSFVIQFTRQQLQIVTEGGVSNVTLTAQYVVNGGGGLPVECFVTGKGAEIFDLSAKVDLVISYDRVIEPRRRVGLWVAITLIILALIIVGVIVVVVFVVKGGAK